MHSSLGLLTVHRAAFFLRLALVPGCRCLSTSIARSLDMSGVARFPTAQRAKPTT